MKLKCLILVAAIGAPPLLSHAADESAAFGRCAVIQNDKQRLACYDAIRDRSIAEYRASLKPGTSTPQMALADLKTDIRELNGKRVTTAGKIQVVGGLEMVFLKTDEFDMAPVTMRADGLPREDRKKLLNGCQMVLCSATVVGTVRRTPIGFELNAESVAWR